MAGSGGELSTTAGKQLGEVGRWPLEKVGESVRLRLAGIPTDASTSFHTGLWSEEEPESRSNDRPTGDECCCLGDLIPLLRHGEPPHDGK
jgi:hypothetical protein